MAIYITGDVHGDPKSRFDGKNMIEGDIVIVTGDFGLPWWPEGVGKAWNDERKLDWLYNQPYTTLFVDGNHENFDLLYQFPVRQWNGGLVHEIRPNVLHLMRGEIFTIDGFVFFAFGGAMSTDKEFRCEGKSWWKQEIYSPIELMNAKQNLQKVNYNVDIVITHTAPRKFLQAKAEELYMKELWFERMNNDPVSKMLSRLEEKLRYRMWYFGHFHFNWVNEEQKCRGIYMAIDKLE